MADNNLMTATVSLEVDSTKAVKQAEQAAQKLQARLAKDQKKLSDELSKNMEASTKRLGNAAQKGLERIGPIVERAFKVSVGVGMTAVYAFLKNGTPEALKFAASIDRVKIAWGKVGEKLATRIKFGDKTGAEWVETFANRLENLDTKQLEKIVGYVKALGYAFAGIQIARILIPITQMAAAFSQMQAASKQMQAAKMLSAVNQSNNMVGAGAINAGAIGAGAIGAGAIGGSNFNPVRIQGRMNGAVVIGEEKRLLSDRIDKTWKSFKDEIIGRRKSNVMNRSNALIGVGAVASSAYSVSQDNSNLNVGTNLGKLAATAIGSFAGPIGAAIGFAVVETTDQLFKAQQDNLRRIADELIVSIKSGRAAVDGYNSETEYRANLVRVSMGKSSIKPDEKIISNLTRDTLVSDMYSNNAAGMKSTEGVFKARQGDSRRYIGGDIPINMEQEYLKYINREIKVQEKNLKVMLVEWEKLGDAEKPFMTTLKGQIDAVEGALEKLYGSKDGILVKTKAYLERIKDAVDDYTSQDIVITEANQNIKDSLNKALAEAYKGINEDMADNLLAYDMYAQKALDESPRASQSSITTGSDIASIPAIIASALNEGKNEDARRQLELTEKGIDLEEKYGEMMAKQWELEQERENIKQEHDKRMEEFLKPIGEILKRVEKCLIGSSTAEIGWHTATV